jgi:hypothetical protein
MNVTLTRITGPSNALGTICSICNRLRIALPSQGTRIGGGAGQTGDGSEQGAGERGLHGRRRGAGKLPEEKRHNMPR